MKEWMTIQPNDSGDDFAAKIFEQVRSIVKGELDINDSQITEIRIDGDETEISMFEGGYTVFTDAHEQYDRVNF